MNRHYQNKSIKVGDRVRIHGNPPEGREHTYLKPREKHIDKLGTVVVCHFYEDCPADDDTCPEMNDCDVEVQLDDLVEMGLTNSFDTQYVEVLS